MAQAPDDARFWNNIARKYASDTISDLAGYEKTLERTSQLLKAQDAGFEFGCGTGSTALRLAPHLSSLVATDISAEMIAIAREKAATAGLDNLNFEIAGPDSAQFGEADFDVVFGFNVLHLLRDRAETYRQVHRILKPGGIFISKTPCLSEMNPLIRLAVPVARLFGKAPYVAFFNSEKLAAEIAAAGFEIIAQERHGSGRKDFRPFIAARRR